MFLQPRNSIVDVVQSVGRVMRTSPGKDYGYIILPVGVPAGVAPAKALADNKRFKVVWQVLNALRAHDDRFNAMVNSIELNKGRHAARREQATASSSAATSAPPTGDRDARRRCRRHRAGAGDRGGQIATQAALFSLTDWRDAIYAKIVNNVGTRTYWEDWATDVADIAAAQQTRIHAVLPGRYAELTPRRSTGSSPRCATT